MAKDEKKTVTVDDVEYNVEDLTEEQIVFCNHVADLDRKLANARFNVDQLAFGREAFFRELKASLEAKKAAE